MQQVEGTLTESHRGTSDVTPTTGRHFRDATRLVAPRPPSPQPSKRPVIRRRALPAHAFRTGPALWPAPIADRARAASVWPLSLSACSLSTASSPDTTPQNLLTYDDLPYFIGGRFDGRLAAASRRNQIALANLSLPSVSLPSVSLPTLALPTQLRSVDWQSFSRPVPIGIALGLAVVSLINPVTTLTTSGQSNAAASGPIRTADASASRSAPVSFAFVTTPPRSPLPTTTTTTATTAPPTTTTTAKPKPKVVVKATAPSNTSGCSASKTAAHACWDGLIGQYSWNTTTAFNIMWCESRGNPNAKNPRSTATGLFQILNGPYDPNANVKLAYEMYSKRGWQPWVCKG